LSAAVAPVRLGSREPIMAQLRLAWWRDRLKEPASQWPKGEPLLAALACWDGQHGALLPLVDGWEGLLEDAPLGEGAFAGFAQGRAAACVALAGASAAVEQAGYGWALGDMMSSSYRPDEQGVLAQMVARHNWRQARLPRALRPLAVLQALAARAAKGNSQNGLGAFLLALRLGILGR